MKIPPKIQIVGLVYDVIFCSEKIINDDGNHVSAQVDFHNLKIYIYQNVVPQMADAAFMHEITHAVLLAAGYINDSRLKIDEPFVERMGQIWLQVFNQILEYNLEVKQ